jgi:hypothetical protein
VSILVRLLLPTVFIGAMLEAAPPVRVVPPGDDRIQYIGRWDLRDSLRARYSWPGVGILVRFTGTRIGLLLNDPTNFFNVRIDGIEQNVFHGTVRGDRRYMLAEGLPDGDHELSFTRRNITFEPPYEFSGVILDSTATLLPPPPRSPRRIEFVGDSFTAAESNEATDQELPWEARYPVTNIDKGFARMVAEHFQADYIMTCRSGSGLFCDWRGDTSGTIPAMFDRTLMESSEPSWDFRLWRPQVVVVCLGLNDRSGLQGTSAGISPEKSERFRDEYHSFLARLRSVYPNVSIVAVAAFPPWIRENVGRVVDEERASGHTDVWYGTFDEFPGGYVANGHPTIATHRKMAEQITAVLESMNINWK